VGKSSNNRIALSVSSNSGYRRGYIISSATSTGIPPAILSVTPTDLDVRVSELTLAYSTVANSDHITSSATTTRILSAILSVTPIDLVLPSAILAVAPTDLEVGVSELASANSTSANLVSKSYKGIIHDRESLKTYRTQVVQRVNDHLKRLA
jgi:hypothetical protein